MEQKRQRNIRRGMEGMWVRIPSVRREKHIGSPARRSTAEARPSHPRPDGWGRTERRAGGAGVLRAASATASVLLCDFHLFALCDCDTVADCGGERVDGSVCTLCMCSDVSGELLGESRTRVGREQDERVE